MPGTKPGEEIVMVQGRKMDLPPGSGINSIRLKMMDEAESFSPGGFSKGMHRQYSRRSKYEISESSSLESGVHKRGESLSAFSRVNSNAFSKSKTLVDRKK